MYTSGVISKWEHDEALLGITSVSAPYFLRKISWMSSSRMPDEVDVE